MSETSDWVTACDHIMPNVCRPAPVNALRTRATSRPAVPPQRQTLIDSGPRTASATTRIALRIGVFFDGTNNNMLRDRPNSHSNIVSLYDAHLDDRKTHFAYYLPGVGTPFKEIGELTESSEGKSFAMGGEARIHWAMLNLYNAIHRYFYKSDPLQESEMKTLVTQDLSTHFRHATEEKELRRLFYGINRRLINAVQYERPRITPTHLSASPVAPLRRGCFAIGCKGSAVG